MRLYHGSNVAVEIPKILPRARALDFGAGFYLTTDFEQAKTWAKLTAFRRKAGIPTVSVYEVDLNILNCLNLRKFGQADAAWLRYISDNRTNRALPETCDVIIGPVANDNTMPVINLYLKGDYDEEEALKRLLPYKLKDQYTFRTEKALMALEFCEVVEV